MFNFPLLIVLLLLSRCIKPVRDTIGPKKDYDEGRLPQPGVVGKIHITSIVPPPLTSVKNYLKRPKGAKQRATTYNVFSNRRKMIKKRSIVDLYKTYKSGKVVFQYQGPKKTYAGIKREKDVAEDVDDPSSVDSCRIEEGTEPQESSQNNGSSPDQEVAEGGNLTEDLSASAVEVTSGDKSSAAVQEEPGLSAAQQNQETPQIRDSAPVRQSTRRAEKLAKAVQSNIPQPTDLDNENESSSDSESEAPQLTTEEIKARDEADNLLWHRFLSIFMWPAIMSVIKPTSAQEWLVRQQELEATEAAQSNKSVTPYQHIAGSAASILHDVMPQINRQKRKRRASETPSDDVTQNKQAKVSPVPSRVSSRNKVPKVFD